jgi:2-dehydropantoate 2-reductase
MRISIIGAGALGSLHGVYLANGGHDVTLVDIRSEIVEAIGRQGLHVDGVRGNHTATVRAATPDKARGPVDLVLILVHTDGTADAAKLAARLLTSDGTVITLQNGIGNVEALSDALGPGHVLGGISYNSASFNAPGYTTHTNAGPTLIGELDGSRKKRTEQLAEALGPVGEVRISDNISGVIWNKLVQSCALHGLCALTGLMAGEIANHPEAEAVRDLAFTEAMAVAHARGITLSDSDPMASVKRLSSTVFVRPSMLQHVEQGRVTEIDSQSGALVREGKAVGVPTPVNEAITLLVKARAAHMAKVRSGQSS